MKHRLALTAVVLVSTIGACMLSLAIAQEAGPKPTPPPADPGRTAPPTRTPAILAPQATGQVAGPRKPSHDLSKVTPLQRQLYLSAHRGAHWLYRMNQVKGRFTDGWLPAL